MQVLERFSAAKRPEAANEDRICVTESFAAIADGVTSKLGTGAAVPAPGALAAELICRAVDGLNPSCNAMRAVELISEALRPLRPIGGLAASVAIYSKERREIWVVGDCRYLAGEKRYEPEHAVDELLKRLRSFVISAEIAGGSDEASLRLHDKGREAIQEFLRRQEAFANSSVPSPWSYGVINGQPVPSKFIHVYGVPAQVPEVVLASDGYPRVEPTLSASEDALARVVSADPLCYRLHLATKCVPPGGTGFDDRSYLRLLVSR